MISRNRYGSHDDILRLNKEDISEDDYMYFRHYMTTATSPDECTELSKKIAKDYIPKMLKIGQILYGEVISEMNYGFFIRICILNPDSMIQEREHYIDGLLHYSNMNNNFLSLGDKKLKYRGISHIGRIILVEVIEINEKGYSLKEVPYNYNLDADDILASHMKTEQIFPRGYETTIESYRGIKYSKVIFQDTFTVYKISEKAYLWKDVIFYYFMDSYYICKYHIGINETHNVLNIFKSMEQLNNFEHICYRPVLMIENENKEAYQGAVKEYEKIKSKNEAVNKEASF